MNLKTLTAEDRRIAQGRVKVKTTLHELRTFQVQRYYAKQGISWRAQIAYLQAVLDGTPEGAQP